MENGINAIFRVIWSDHVRHFSDVSVDCSFAQTVRTYDGRPSVVGRWELVAINGSEPEGKKEGIEFEDERLSNALGKPNGFPVNGVST